MVWAVDRLPEKQRRELLANEYEGEALERRLKLRIWKGRSTANALFRMTEINLFPKLRTKDAVPPTPLIALDNSEKKLTEFVIGARPLVINIGSCT